ncbi:putative NAD-dependent epimerase/dehydratase [Hypoxylon fragiforme]|uniref:putative NAD-dependent epimerase/dehydratase n=1 Tax=Hypoxylon fragiforme TaxID=63214 RepID=UPI0020C66687|nr:putative NAD-dependent epimerase/dehydratase [Hypoxylon fragiforme]KAI2607148.1 putative NAD-dependent epimerase/dehydratase [Hypoxylon fragiforme]
MAGNDSLPPVTSTYAVLGSTGNCGTALLQTLLQSPTNKIHAYCRNQAKLHRLIPQVVDNKQIRVFEGSIHDVDLITDCVRGTKAVFMAVTTNDNVPDCRLNQDTAATVIRALEAIRAESSSRAKPEASKLPKLVLLSSSTIDDRLSGNRSWLFRSLMRTAVSYVYADLQLAEKMLRSQADWVSTIFMKPGGLSVDVARGHRLTLDEDESFLSYLDLSAGMLEAVNDEEGRYDGMNVGVVNATRGVGAKFPSGGLLAIPLGLLRHFFPWLHPYLPVAGL